MSGPIDRPDTSLTQGTRPANMNKARAAGARSMGISPIADGRTMLHRKIMITFPA